MYFVQDLFLTFDPDVLCNIPPQIKCIRRSLLEVEARRRDTNEAHSDGRNRPKAVPNQAVFKTTWGRKRKATHKSNAAPRAARSANRGPAFTRVNPASPHCQGVGGRARSPGARKHAPRSVSPCSGRGALPCWCLVRRPDWATANNRGATDKDAVIIISSEAHGRPNWAVRKQGYFKTHSRGPTGNVTAHSLPVFLQTQPLQATHTERWKYCTPVIAFLYSYIRQATLQCTCEEFGHTASSLIDRLRIDQRSAVGLLLPWYSCSCRRIDGILGLFEHSGAVCSQMTQQVQRT
ncbi:hypothetical protein AAFF_G00108430 [Aldrovandia affinis]|uniref:Uncharacterized protein n=1 Tax=Aldrovandia affinis TaxID=143900 RepID=A0AAD7RTU3_9TELE|nr:hypothetical protein AAFF_G00108430 [Aldrovandia affinis]